MPAPETIQIAAGTVLAMLGAPLPACVAWVLAGLCVLLLARWAARSARI